MTPIRLYLAGCAAVTVGFLAGGLIVSAFVVPGLLLCAAGGMWALRESLR